MPLPALAIYFSATEVWAAYRAGGEARELMILGLPLAIGAATLGMIALAVRRKSRRPL